MDQIPISTAAGKLAETSKLEKLEHVFCDGEDYELLFTLSTNTNRFVFEKNWQQSFPNTRLTCIGLIKTASTEGPYLNAKTKTKLTWTSGFEHF